MAINENERAQMRVYKEYKKANKIAMAKNELNSENNNNIVYKIAGTTWHQMD